MKKKNQHTTVLSILIITLLIISGFSSIFGSLVAAINSPTTTYEKGVPGNYKVKTPTGWRRIDEISIGDEVYTRNEELFPNYSYQEVTFIRKIPANDIQSFWYTLLTDGNGGQFDYLGGTIVRDGPYGERKVSELLVDESWLESLTGSYLLTLKITHNEPWPTDYAYSLITENHDEINGKIVNAKVIDLYHHSSDEMMDYYLIINGKLRLTTNHPLYINDEWMFVENAKIGDHLFGKDGSDIIIKSIKQVFEKVPTYNLEIAMYQNYFADGILAHNKISTDTPEQSPTSDPTSYLDHS